MVRIRSSSLAGVIGSLAAIMTVLAGCRGSTSASIREGTARRVTFTRDIAPIVFQQCTPCHRPEESAPFSLITYQDVRQRARAIVAATERRVMPPWLPQPGYAEFAGERRLTSSQIETFRRWQEDGVLEGELADLPPLPHFTPGWQLGQPDLAIKLPQPYILRPGGPEVWRNFVIPIPVRAPRYVRTVELRPGTAMVVHHALIGVDSTRSSRRRDERDDEPGFDGMDMGDAQSPDGHLLGWTPGMVPFPGVKDKSWRLDPGSDLVLQLHLIPSGKPETVDPIVGFYFTEAAPVGPPMYLMRLDADHAIDIAPGDRNFVVTDSFELPVDVEVLAVYPHAHFLAKTMEGVAKLPDGSEKQLLRINEWNFKWQDIYRYATPIPLPRGTIIGMRYSYDNSSDNVRNPNRPPRRVVAGLRSSDEMAHLQLQLLPRNGEDALLLKEGLYRHAIEKNPGDVWAYYELGNAVRDRGRPLEAVRQYRAALEHDARHAATHNNLGVVLEELGQVDEAIGHYGAALRSEPDFADAHYNLANVLRSKGRLNDAIAQYRKALRLEPDLGEAHNNLGEIFGSQGKPKEAIAEFRQAVRINPNSAEAHNNLGASLGSLGEVDEAITHLRRALQLQPDNVRARENLKIALAKATGSRGIQP